MVLPIPLLLLLIVSVAPASPSVQLLQVRENVNLTMTCHFDSSQSSMMANELSSSSPLASFELYLGSQPTENIILWYKDNTKVIGVNSISNDAKKYSITQLNLHTYQLTIINVQLESSGLYKCQNFTAKEENRFQLNVIVPPSRLHLTSSSSATNIHLADGRTTVFNCTCERAFPVPMFEWYNHGELIQRSTGNQTGSVRFASSSILTLSLTPADHNHMLRCRVSNEADIHQIIAEMKLDVQFKPTMNMSANNQPLGDTLAVIENTVGTVQCQVAANPPAQSAIEWLRNDQLLVGENREQLRINFTQVNRVEKLTCRAKNAIGQSDATVSVHLLYQPKLSMTERLVLNQDETLTLQCAIDANPPCQQVRWFHNGKELLMQPCSALNSTHNIAEYRIENVSRLHAGKYTCEVRNWLHNSWQHRYEAMSTLSTEVRVQYAPFILNAYKKLAVLDNREVIAECIVDADPKAEVAWFSPSGQRLSAFTEERSVNSTVIASVLHLPPSSSSVVGVYRCVAKNIFGERDLSVQFQRPGLPDAPAEAFATNITHASFQLHWQAGYDGGSDQVFHIALHENHTEERQTTANVLQLRDLQENALYIVTVRSRNAAGFSNDSARILVRTHESPVHADEFPTIRQARPSADGRRVQFQLQADSSSILSKEHLCLQYYDRNNHDDTPSCVALSSIHASNEVYEVDVEPTNTRLKLCLLNQTDVCATSIPVPAPVPLPHHSSEWILIVMGGLLGLCFVFVLIGAFVCLARRRRKQTSRNGSTDTLKTNADHCHSIPVRVSDTNSCLYYPAQIARQPEGAGFSYANETAGTYNFQGETQRAELRSSSLAVLEKKTSACFDSGMPSTTSNNSDSACSQVLSSSESDDRSDGAYLVNRKIVLSDVQHTFLSKISETHSIPSFSKSTGKTNPWTTHEKISPDEQTGFSTSNNAHHGKKLVYEVVV